MSGTSKAQRISSDLVAGIIIGISIILWCLTLAALIFKGDLALFAAVTSS